MKISPWAIFSEEVTANLKGKIGSVVKSIVLARRDTEDKHAKHLTVFICDTDRTMK